MQTFSTKAARISYCAPTVKFITVGAIATLMTIVFSLGMNIPFIHGTKAMIVPLVADTISAATALLFFIVSFTSLFFDFIDETRVMNRKVRNAFCYYRNGNPLNLKEGEKLPKFTCEKFTYDLYHIRVIPNGVNITKLMEAGSYVSAALNKRFKNFVVIDAATDRYGTYVEYTIRDISVDRNFYFRSINDMKPSEISKNRIRVQKGTLIDLKSCGSILVAGKTRSGKTTGVISIILQALVLGRDNFGSEIMIIDPKMAELSRLPHTYTLDNDGEAKNILKAIKHFSETITKRQDYLNDLSEKTGNAVKWWEAGMHCSFLFIDEYVALRSILPKKPLKNAPDYSLEAFDNLLKRIVTMGASAGCFVIVSIAEASVQEGGLPSMLRSAMQTKILFKPTLTEGKLLWDNVQLEKFQDGQTYKAGDAWFSSPDGVNDNVQPVHFPIMDFDVYKQLGRQLSLYYKKGKHHNRG